jgi:3-oxoadipate CoA-transferase alpha subunit
MGLGAVFTPTGYGTLLAEGKETRHIDGKDYVLEYPIKADFALIKAQQGDRWGNWFTANRHVTSARLWPWRQV